jgi:hypothetical protein
MKETGYDINFIEVFCKEYVLQWKAASKETD